MNEMAVSKLKRINFYYGYALALGALNAEQLNIYLMLQRWSIRKHVDTQFSFVSHVLVRPNIIECHSF